MIFPIGDAGPRKPGKATQALQLLVGGLVFSVLLAMAALGLSMIFGTTGLTNFAHGELITFGALVAFTFDRSPADRDRRHRRHRLVGVIVGVRGLGGRSAGSTTARCGGRCARRGTGLIAMMIVSIGLSIFLRNVYQYFAGAQAGTTRSTPPVEP